MAVYDDEETNTKDLHEVTGISKDEMQDMEARAVASADQDRAQLDDLERSFAAKPATDNDLPENHPSQSKTNDTVGSGFNNKDSGSRLSQFKGKFTRKRTLTGVLLGSIVGGGLFGFSIIQGPAQFVQFAQLLQKFHLQQNEEFGDDRMSKVLLYSLLGMGTERGRLGITTNKAADIWEKNLEKKTGLRPVYTQRTGRFLGYEITNRNTFENFAGGFNENDTSRIEQLMGKGVEIRNVSELSTDQAVVRGKNGSIPDNAKIIDASRLSFKDRRILISTIGRATNMNSIGTAIGTRLAKKRYGVDFHIANKVRAANDKLETRKKVLKEWYESVKNGVKPGRRLGKDTTTDADGKPNQSVADQAATDVVEEVKNEIETQVPENAGTESAKSVRSKIITRAGGTAAVAVGALCAAKDYGNGIQEYKYTNYVLPMMRMGMNIVSLGNQVMSGDNISLDDLNIFSDLLYDEETKTSWMGARSIQAENGQPQTGPDLPEEAKPGNLSEKPEFFKKIDSIPILGTACSITDFVSGLPVIKQVGDATSSLVNSVTHLDDLVEKSFAIIAGQGVDPLSKGAAFGNLTNVGAFLSGNDQAISMGGAALTPAQTAALKQHQKLHENKQRGHKSIAQRYLDPYDSGSVFGSLINKVPADTSQVASVFTNPIKSISSIFSGTLSGFAPDTSAATIDAYDYGIPKYGFSLDDQSDDRFEDPYQNAQIVEPMLDELNSKYSKCFSITVSVDDNGVHIESGDAVNVFDLQKDNPECDPAKNSDPNFLRYRFYVADSVMALSAACYEADDDNACEELGLGSGGAPTNSPVPGGNLEANKDKFTEILKLPAGAVGPPEIGFYHQCQDPRWAAEDYPYVDGGANDICASACGPTSIAMVVSTIGSEIVNPQQMALKAKQWHVKSGTAMSGAITLVEQYGLKYRKIPASGSAIKQVLSGGGFVILNANSASPFTQAGHFIVVRGISEDGTKFWVADPADDNSNGQNRNQQAWPVSSIGGWLGVDGLYAVEKQ